MGVRIPELLSPAGGVDAARAAVEAGCDAVYVGGSRYSARAQAENVDSIDMPQLIDYCHLRGVKVYIAVNTLLVNSEIQSALGFCMKCREWGCDAFICQDMGLARLLREHAGDVELHASTQLTARTVADVMELRDAGFKRVILSRELDLAAIREISETTGVESEVFAHGSMCFSFSGQCLMSGIIGKRSGNRGKCAQPCRKPYELAGGEGADGYLMSMKDLNTLEILEDYAAAGVAAVKIEGRMKNAAYVYYVTRAYRERLSQIAVGDGFSETDAMRRARAVFARGGFTNGYSRDHSGGHMVWTRTPKSTGGFVGSVIGYDADRGICRVFCEAEVSGGDGIEVFTKKEPHAGAYVNQSAAAGEVAVISVKGEIGVGDKVYKSYDKKLMDDAKRLVEKGGRRVAVGGAVCARIGEPVSLTLKYGGTEITKTGAVFERAEKTALSPERIIDQVSKNGQNPFNISLSNCEVDEGGFVAASALNELRRQCAEALSAGITEARRREKRTAEWRRTAHTLPDSSKLSAHCRDREQMGAALESGAIKRIYLEPLPSVLAHFDRAREECSIGGAELYITLPPEADDLFDDYLSLNADGFLCQTLGALRRARALGKTCAADYTLNVTNQVAFDYIGNQADTVCLSAETNAAALRDMCGNKTESLIYGKLPLMTTRQCPIGIYIAGKGAGKYCAMRGKTHSCALKDRLGVKFPIITRCGACEAQILNGKPVCMLNRMESVAGAAWLRLNFTDEPQGRVLDICRAFGGGAAAGERVSAALREEGFTYGWFFAEL